MTVELLIGIDLGTTVTKAAVVGLDGQELAWGKAPTPWHDVGAGAETAPADLLGGALQAAAAALEAAPPGRVLGLGVTSMAETVVFLGNDGRPVGRSIAWHDDRGDDEARDLVETFGSTGFSARTGLPPSHVCTLVKLAWLAAHEALPGARAMNIADWVVHALGAEQASEASLASRTGALSLAGRQWWAEGLQWARVPADLFPPVAQAGQALGHVRRGNLADLPSSWPRPDDAAGRELLGRLESASLASAGHDHLCVAAGAGAIGTHQILDSCGTAEAFVRRVAPLEGRAVSDIVQAGLNIGWHTVPGSYALMAGQSLGLLLERVARLLGMTGSQALTALDQAATAVPPGTLRVLQEEAYGLPSIAGIGPDASPAALWSAALAAAASGALDILSAMKSVAGPAEELVLSGGWSHFAGLLRDRQRLSPRLRWPAVTEAGARGAALFGGCAAGVFSGPEAFPTAADRQWEAATTMTAQQPPT